jgi:hypothetical protein
MCLPQALSPVPVETENWSLRCDQDCFLRHISVSVTVQTLAHTQARAALECMKCTGRTS